MKFKYLFPIILLFSTAFSANQLTGVQTHFGQFRRADMDSTSVEAQLDLCAEAGIQVIRDECLWSDVELDSGIYIIPPEVDRYVRSALSRQIQVYLILNYNNSLYAPSNGSAVTNENNRTAYARYCQAIVSHFYPLGVRHYEIWNEPNHGVLFWTPQPNANDYYKLLQAAHDSIKAVEENAIVIGCATSPAIGNSAPYIEGLDFIRDVFNAGGANYMDAVSFHLYQIAYRPENELQKYVNSVKSYVGDMPIYLSETGYPTHEAWPNISLEKQARYVTRMFLTARLDDQIKGVIYYDLKNDGTLAEEAEHNFGLLHFGRNPKPAYNALKYLQQESYGSAPETWEYKDDVYSFNYQNGMSIYWAYSGSKDIFISPKNLPAATWLRTYATLDMFGDTNEFHITQNDSIFLHIDEDPSYNYLIKDDTHINNFEFKHSEYLLYPGEKVNLDYSAKSKTDIPVYIEPSALIWDLKGTNGSLQGKEFTASLQGSSVLLAEIHDKTDSVHINVIPDPGHYIIEDFSDTANFILESNHLNFETSKISSNGTTLNIDYEYNRSYATVYLHKNILINHRADSIYLDMKTDDNIFEFRLYCRDASGQTYTVGVKPKPTDWTNSWGSVSGPLNIASTATAPVYLENIYIKMKPGETSQTMHYSGCLKLDNLRLKKGNALAVSEKDKIPESIELSQNYPNPFNGSTRVFFSIPNDSKVKLEILDLRGHAISTEINKLFKQGNYEHSIDMNGLPSGIYFYRLSTKNTQICKKLAYVK